MGLGWYVSVEFVGWAIGWSSRSIGRYLDMVANVSSGMVGTASDTFTGQSVIATGVALGIGRAIARPRATLRKWGDARLLGCPGQPDDPSDAGLYLSSDRAECVGPVLCIAGGGTLQ